MQPRKVAIFATGTPDLGSIVARCTQSLFDQSWKMWKIRSILWLSLCSLSSVYKYCLSLKFSSKTSYPVKFILGYMKANTELFTQTGQTVFTTCIFCFRKIFKMTNWHHNVLCCLQNITGNVLCS